MYFIIQLVGGNGELNTDKRVRLQLYRCPKVTNNRNNDAIEVNLSHALTKWNVIALDH